VTATHSTHPFRQIAMGRLCFWWSRIASRTANFKASSTFRPSAKI